jgi:hypothetical protein
MSRKVVTDSLDAADLRADLHRNLRLLQDMGIKAARLFFLLRLEYRYTFC